jgi:hypothetical protein
MICAHCASAADLTTAARQDDAEHPIPLKDRISNVVGRPYIYTVINRAVLALHLKCRGCDCQHSFQGVLT